MAPRRKTRKSTQAEVDDAEAASQDADRLSPAVALAGGKGLNLGPLLDEVDTTTLEHVLPDVSFENPTAEMIVRCYRLIVTQLEQLEENEIKLDDLGAQVEKNEVELDQALQDKESSLKELEGSVDSLQNEVAQVKRERDELSTARSTLQTQLALIESTHSSSSLELDSLRRKVEDVEREKRDLLGVVSRLEDDVASGKEETGQLRESVRTSRKEYQELESTVRELRSTETSIKFKVETLTQQLQLARDENERTNAELSSKSDQYSLFRREKHAEIVQLQSKLDSLQQEHNHTVNTLQSAQASRESQSQQLSQALQNVQDLTGQLADQEAKYSSEAANLRRLNQMLEERDAQVKAIVDGIEKDWEGLGAKTAKREQELRDALEAEEERSAHLEKQVEDMKVVMERINRGELPLPSADRRSSAVQSSEGLYDLSSGLAMINRMQKSGKSFTEVYADYIRLQDELVKKSVENERLDRALNEIMAEIEERAPILSQQRQDFERVQEESMLLASHLSDVTAERDARRRYTEELEEKLTKTERVIAMHEQQSADLGRQVQVLLREIARRDDPSLPPDEELTDDDTVDGIVNKELVVFRSIPELQDNYRKMLVTLRDLTKRIENEDEKYRERLDREQAEAILEAHEAIQTLQSQMEIQQKSAQQTVQAYIKETETLKAMLKRQDRNESVSINQANGQPIRDFERNLREAEDNFDSYRHEIGVDTMRLRDEVAKYQREAGQLGAALAKANAKIEHLDVVERHRMDYEQRIAHERDYDNISKRNRELLDQYMKLELACSHATEELGSATSQTNVLRNECANLRAEKKIWESTQLRLIDENKVLSIERSRLSDLLVNVQKLHNDVDRSYDNDKRRLESQIQSLEAQSQDLRSQISRERDASREASLKQDMELRELRTKLETTSGLLAGTREKLVGAETSQKHLQDRVSDLLKQVQTKNEKLSVYERPPADVLASGTLSTSRNDHGDSEQQLKAEVAELRGARKALEVDLATARSRVQQFQDISQACEAALAALSATHDEYKTTTEASIATTESQRAALEERVASLEKDLSSLTEKNLELSRLLDNERLTFANDKKTLEDTIVDITSAEKSSLSDQATREAELKEQEKRAKDAEDKYSREVLSHAESIKQVEGLKQELDQARSAIREQTTSAETAQAKLVSSESSWEQQKVSLNKVILDLTARCKDLVSQNNVLHQHLETITSQASRIRSTADPSSSAPSDASDAENSDSRLTELRSVVAYLRKEKDIVDLQLELCKQENARFKGQVEYLSKNLDEVRATLSSEREQAVRSVENSREHAELLDRINQLNLLRESNATLRSECDAQTRRARQLQTSLDQLQTELEPSKADVKAARAEVEEKNRQILQLEEENRQWKERNSQLLTKYDRIDPNDVQTLKDEIEDLQIDIRNFETEKATMVQEAQEKAKTLEETSSALAESKVKYQTLLNQSRNRVGTMNNQITELRNAITKITAERDQLKSQTSSVGETSTISNDEIEKLKGSLAALTAEKNTIEKSLADEKRKSAATLADLNTLLSKLREEKDTLLKEKAQWTAGQTSSEVVAVDNSQLSQQFEAEKAEIMKARDEAISRAEAAQKEVTAKVTELQGVRMQNDKFQARIVDNEKRKAADAEKIAALIAKHKEEQEAAVLAATEKLRAELQTPVAASEEAAPRHAEELRALVARLKEEHQKELEEAVERVQKQADQANDELQEAVKNATDRGRMEANTKIKLKDAMLQKTGNKVKFLEEQIKAWRDAGIIPADAPVLPAPVAAPATPAIGAATASQTPLTPSPKLPTSAGTASATQTPTAASPPTSLPRKPPVATAGPSSTATAAVGAARGLRSGLRQIQPQPPARLSDAGKQAAPGTTNAVPAPVTAPPARGAAAGRGGAALGTGRGGIRQIPAIRPPPAGASTSTPPAGQPAAGGVSIMGAAGKRAREDSGTPDSLAKRIKPAEAIAGKPVALRRDRIPPSNPPPAS